MKGLTLIELLVSITLSTILISTGVPSLKYLISRHEAQVAVSSLKKVLVLGRFNAIKKQSHITICPIKQNQCINDWSRPIVTFTDRNSNLKVDTNETLHYTTQVDSSWGNWQKKRMNKPFVRFNPLGHAFSSATTFLYCPKSGLLQGAKQIIINFQGRIRTKAYLSSMGTPFSNVSPLFCS
jgi:type IV fimbrial biogenesis protein FimT